MEFRVRNVNDGFSTLVETIHFEKTHLLTKQDTRNGPVLSFDEPVLITYSNPLERVLFNANRDANPFFHLVEALWMLAGRNDIAIPAYFASNMRSYSDDGVTQHAAYGHRWRSHFQAYTHSPDACPSCDAPHYDQLNVIIEELKRDLGTRRLCLGMWDPYIDLPLLRDNPKCKDLPCNTHAYFRVTEGKYLELTVCNRSNDLVWGTFGANAVHMSVLQEYVALCSGLQVGVYHQFTNNLHTYLDKWKPEKWLLTCRDFYDVTPGEGVSHFEGGKIPLVIDKATFDVEVKVLLDCLDKHYNVSTLLHWDFKEPFLMTVAVPLICAFVHHKHRGYASAHLCLDQCTAPDWQHACRVWLTKRELAFEKRSDPNYEA